MSEGRQATVSVFVGGAWVDRTFDPKDPDDVTRAMVWIAKNADWEDGHKAGDEVLRAVAEAHGFAVAVRVYDGLTKFYS